MAGFRSIDRFCKKVEWMEDCKYLRFLMMGNASLLGHAVKIQSRAVAVTVVDDGFPQNKRYRRG